MCRCFRKDRNIGGFDFNLNYTIMTHYESLKESISPQMLKTAAATLREDEKGVASAVAVLLPSLLVRFMDQGETARVNETIREAGNAELFDRRAEIFAGHGIDGGMNLGERFENELVGRKTRPIRMPWRPKAVSPQRAPTGCRDGWQRLSPAMWAIR